MKSVVSTSSGQRHWMNLYEITNLEELVTSYRLLEIRGITPGDHYDKCLNQLQKRVTYELKRPVALVRRGDLHCLAIPSDADLPRLEQQVMPFVAQLVPDTLTHRLALDNLSPDEAAIGTTFLTYALRTPLMRDHELWGGVNRYFQKAAVTRNDLGAEVDIYAGFVWNLFIGDGRRIFLTVDLTTRYVDRRWLTERLGSMNIVELRGRHCLYHFGHEWYIVQFGGLTGQTVAAQRFVPEGSTEAVDVLTYTQERWRANRPPWVQNLDPTGPAMMYRYPGNRKERHGALGLGKLTFKTDDPRVRHLHRRSIVPPETRFQRVNNIVRAHFQTAELEGTPIRVAPEPLEIPRRVFHVPSLQFGQDRVLAIAPSAADDNRGVVPLKDLGRHRLRLLLDRDAGPLSREPFDAQYVLLPRRMPRGVNEDFVRQFRQTMQQISGRPEYAAKMILYEDGGATLAQQVRAIEQSLTDQQVARGYALLVLPERAQPDLHNVIKRKLWPDLQFQCARAEKVRGYYSLSEGEAQTRILPGKDRELANYVRNCALAMMVVNRRWGWALADALEHDLHIGIDVLNGMAGLTFIYGAGRHIVFRDFPSRQKERLSAALIRDAIVTSLQGDLEELGLRPRSIVVHRDGRSFASERQGLQAAVRQLKTSGVLPHDTSVGIVDVRKTNTNHFRLVEGVAPEVAMNPEIGSYHLLDSRTGVVCTTGWPFSLSGTVNPLVASVVEGPLVIERVLKDIFALSQLVFTAPDKCMRLPLTIKLTDDFLEPIAAEADEDGARYDDELLGEADTTDDDQLEYDQVVAAASSGKQ